MQKAPGTREKAAGTWVQALGLGKGHLISEWLPGAIQ